MHRRVQKLNASIITYFVPRLRHLRCVGTNLEPAARRSEPDDNPLAGDKLSEATASLTDSFELDELGAGDGGSNFNDNL